MMKRIFALIISRLFDPIVVFFIAVIVMALDSGMTGAPFINFLVVFVLFGILPPVVMLFWAVKTKRVSDIDISNRAQRVRVLFMFGLLLLVDYFVIKLFGNPYLEMIFTLFVVWFFGFFLITLFWKISGHIAGLTLVFGLLSVRFGFKIFPFIILIPLVAWARVITKKHTIAQVVGGFLYSIFVLTFVKYIR